MNRGFSIRRTARSIAPFALAAIPLSIAPGFLYFYDVTPKVAWLYFATAAALPFIDPRRLLNRARGRLFCMLLGAAFLSLLVSSVFSVRTDLSLFGTNWRRFGLITQTALLLFAFIAAVDLSGGVERVRVYLRVSVLATLGIAIYGILQYLGWDPWLDGKTYHVGSGVWTIVRPPGTLGYVTYFANYLVFGAFQGLASVRLETSVIWRRVAGIAAALASIAIVLSGTRADWLALVGGGAVLMYFDARLPRRRTLWIASGLAVVLLGFYLSPLGLQLRSRMRWFREDPGGGARLYLWRDSVRLIGRGWLTGTGPETFSVAFPQVQSRDLSRAFPEFYHESAHNIFLDAGTAGGLPALLILIVLSGIAFRTKVKVRSDVPVLLAGFTAILVCHQFSVFTVPTALGFWITLAMLVTADCAPERFVKPFDPDRGMLWLAPLSLALIVAATRMTLADRHLAETRTSLDASRFDAAQTDYLAAAQLGMHADLWYSRKLLAASQQTRVATESLSRTQRALAGAESATRTAEDTGNAWMNLGLIYARLNNAVRTEYCLRQAIAASPNWYKPHFVLSKLLVALRRQEDAQKELLLAEDLNPAMPVER